MWLLVNYGLVWFGMVGKLWFGLMMTIKVWAIMVSYGLMTIVVNYGLAIVVSYGLMTIMVSYGLVWVIVVSYVSGDSCNTDS